MSIAVMITREISPPDLVRTLLSPFMLKDGNGELSKSSFKRV